MSVNLIKLESIVYGTGSSSVSVNGLTATVRGNAGTETDICVPLNKKIYFELKCISGIFNYFGFGLVNKQLTCAQYIGSSYGNIPENMISNMSQDTSIPLTINDVIGIAIDLKTLNFKWYLNGILKGDFTLTFTNYFETTKVSIRTGATAAPDHMYTMNFGQNPLDYPIPAGYEPWFGAINAKKLYKQIPVNSNGGGIRYE